MPCELAGDADKKKLKIDEVKFSVAANSQFQVGKNVFTGMFSDIKTPKGINTILLRLCFLVLFCSFLSFIVLPSQQPSTDITEIVLMEY